MGNLHTEDLGDLVDIDLREDDLLGDAEGVVALTVEPVSYTHLDVYTRQLKRRRQQRDTDS